MRFRIEKYNETRKEEWNQFIENARNSTFLFNRDFMDYHADRFRDHSLMAYMGGSLRGVLPANIIEDTLQSHGGLTYGGWVVGERHVDACDVLELFRDTAEYCRKEGIKTLDYKPMPWIYSRQPSQEDIYALSRMGAIRTECSLSATIRLNDNPGFSTLQRRNMRGGEDKFIIEEKSVFSSDGEETLKEYHEILKKCLEERHGAKPVHTCVELIKLMKLFPENIRLHCIFNRHGIDKEMLGGVLMFDTTMVAHAQYIASTPEGRIKHALPVLFNKLIREDYSGREYFDFGISTENQGLYLNEGLMHQKYGFGGRGTVYERYQLNF